MHVDRTFQIYELLHNLMINTILLESNAGELSLLAKITKCCPCLVVNGISSSLEGAKALLEENQFDLIVINLKAPSFVDYRKVLENNEIETIYVSYSNSQALIALQSRAAEYLIRPISDKVLINAVEKVRGRLRRKEENIKKKLLFDNLFGKRKTDQSIGIPTMEGFVFFSTSEIIRCEGLQKCTRIITTTKTDIISSYNIGEFKKLLEPYGFFATHKSHLINLTFVKHYRREGTIILKDNSSVPVAKRRKGIFLKQVVHP